VLKENDIIQEKRICKMLSSQKTSKKHNFLWGTIILLFFALCTELFRRMACRHPSMFIEGHYYVSDISMRMSMERGTQYSLFLFPEFLVYDGLGKDVGSLLIGIYLAIFVVGTIVVVYLLLSRLCADSKPGLLALCAFASLFFMPVFIPSAGPLGDKLYVGYPGSIWHNETYIGMRFFAILLLIFFRDTCNRYLEKFSIKEFFISCLLFSAVNIVKPNFIIAFAPAMLIMMIADIITSKGKGFSKWVMYGVPVLISSVVLLFQFLILFQNTESTESTQVIFVLGDAIKQQKHPIIVFLRTYAFPIYMLIIHRKELSKSKFHIVCCLGWFFSFLEYLFLSETGFRATHGNFSWGLHFFTFLVFCLSVGYWINDLTAYTKRRNSKNTPDKSQNIKLIFSTLLLGLHFISGLLYFGFVLLGW
jgi:hypothetical protein